MAFLSYVSTTDEKQVLPAEASRDYEANISTVEEGPRRPNPFLDPKVAKHYKEIYDAVSYECRHVFDPSLDWTSAEEKQVVRKVDWHICTWACIMFFALQIDRKNLSQAVSADMLEQLNLTTNEYNYGNTIFLVSFLLAALPQQLISKRVGPDRSIPVLIVSWSIIGCSQAAITNRSGFYACRSLLGLLEGGFIPDIIVWLSYFYTNKELPLRLSFFWATIDAAGILTSLLAFALLHLNGIHGIAGWRYLFLIEGLLTLAVGVAAWFLMPSSAVAAKGWLDDEEVGILVNRVLRDDPSKGDMHNRMGITPKLLWQALTDYDLWPIYLIGLVVYIPMSPQNQYLTLTLRHLGFSTFHTNLLTIPSAVASICTLIGITWLSERIDERAIVATVQNIWALPCLIALRWWPGSEVDAWGTFALVTVLLSYPYSHPIVVGWASRNSGSVRTRAISAVCYNVCIQLGTIIAANVYMTEDAPLYHRGNTVLFALNIFSIALFLGTKRYYIERNRSRAKKWGDMTEQRKEDYRNDAKDNGNKRLDFRFVH